MNEDAIFAQAIALPPDQREEFLRRVCGDEEALQTRIEALLKAHEALSEVQQSVDVELVSTSDPASAGGQGRRSVGHYRLLQVIGEGGMGIVYMAQQTRPIERRVALKIIKPGMDSTEVLARFEAERQALAMMDHPNIARVLDAGTTESGRPYFVMELVKGIPITRFCDEHHLTLRERLELFVPVCQAVQHAHQKGIIHRDLKPSNILVAHYDDRPIPKIIDFGVAKAISKQLTEKTLFTQFGQIVGTLDYMSPEQARFNQLDIDTRSDIYSLGVLLYELLTGETPFDRHRLRSVAFDELLRIIREEDPPRPSARLSSAQFPPSVAVNRKTELRKLSVLLRGELDWIVMKALAKERTRRYETANSLASDVWRHLNNEPVAARPSSLLYQMQKVTRRHRGAFVAALCVLVSLIVGLGFATWGFVEADRQRGIAQAERDIAVDAQRQTSANAEQLSRQNYLLHLGNADRALLAHDYSLAETELNVCPAELRTWEWRFLMDRMRATVPLTLDLSEDPVFTQDGNRLIAIGAMASPERRQAQVWDLPSETLVRTFEHGQDLSKVALSPDEKSIVGCGQLGEVFLWNIQTGQKEWSVHEHQRNIEGVAFSPDGRWIATAGDDGMLKVFDATNGGVRFSQGPFEAGLRKIAFSPDGRWMATSLEERATDAILVDMDSAKIVARFPGAVPTFSPSGTLIVSGNDDGSITLWSWDGREMTRQKTWENDGEPVLSLAFTEDGTRLASGHRRGAVRLWDVETGTQIAVFDTADYVYWLKMRPGHEEVAIFTVAGGVCLWRYGDHDESLTIVPHEERNGLVWPVRFSPDSQKVAVGSYVSEGGESLGVRHGGPVAVIDVETGQAERLIEGSLLGVSWTPDSLHLVASRTIPDYSIQMYDVDTGSLVQSFSGHDDYSVPFVEPSGDRMTSVSRDGTIRTWSLRKGRAENVLAVGHKVNPETSISRDGSRVAVGYFWLHEVTIWERGRGKTTRTIPLPTGWLQEIVFNHDGDHIYVCRAAGKLSLVDLDTGRETRTFSGHRQRVNALAISPDGKQIVSGDESGQIIIWDVQYAQRVLTLIDSGEPITSLDWSGDGTRIAAGFSDATVRIWDVPWSAQ